MVIYLYRKFAEINGKQDLLKTLEISSWATQAQSCVQKILWLIFGEIQDK